MVYKPFGMLSQFSGEGERKTLSELFSFPKDVYPVGRLDAESEGLLILTNDKRLNYELLHPEKFHCRTYLVQVEGEAGQEDLKVIENGMWIRNRSRKVKTRNCMARIVTPPACLAPRIPPVRFRKNIPTSWIEITLTEGKNRQVRKMTAAAGFPALRLIRTGIEDLKIGKMKPGEVNVMNKRTMYRLLKISAVGSGA